MRERDEFATAFWRRASGSLPPAVRRRYLLQLKSAESFELALDRAVEAWKSLAQLLHPSPHRPAH
jgi:hypothetical protein